MAKLGKGRRRKSEGRLHSLPAKVYVRRTRGGAFRAQACIGSFTGRRSFSTPGGHATEMKSRCGNGSGRNPRVAISRALSGAARLLRSGREGAFAGLGKKGR